MSFASADGVTRFSDAKQFQPRDIGETPDSNLIVVVDDDDGFTATVARQAADRGWRTLAFRSFEPGLTALREHRPARLLFEPFLPSSYGTIKLLDAIRSELPAMAVYAVSAYPSVATALDLVRAGAVVDYLTKPVSRQVLASVLDCPAPPRLRPRQPEPDAVPSLGRIEWEYITWVMARCGGNLTATASLLGVSRNTLQRRLRKHPPAR
jgi:two-component system response regulator RegA